MTRLSAAIAAGVLASAAATITISVNTTSVSSGTTCRRRTRRLRAPACHQPRSRQAAGHRGAPYAPQPVDGVLMRTRVRATAPHVQISNLDWVRVSFDGLAADEAKDAWIGLFSPANASVKAIAALPYPATSPWTEQAPVKFITLAMMNNGANTTGKGYWDL